MDNSPQTNIVKVLDASAHEALDYAKEIDHIIDIPDDALVFTLACDRSEFPDSSDAVIECISQILINEEWVLLCSFKAAGGDIGINESSMKVTLPSGKNRKVKTSFIPIHDLTTSISVKF